MRRLTLNDAAFLYNETTRTPMHIASVQHIRLPEGLDGESFTQRLREQIGARVSRVPYLRERLVESPWQLDHPSFADCEVTINRHVHRIVAPSPGDARALEAAVARLHEKPLDRQRPLWEMVVIDGLADGRVAIYSRVHHCCIDGMAGQEATRLLYDPADATATAETVESVPGPVAASASAKAGHPMLELIHAFENFSRSTEAFMRALPEVVRNWDRMQQRLAAEGEGWNGGTRAAPDTPLNRPVGSSRTWAIGAMSVAELKVIGRSCGATLNDVVLSICGGGLRNFLARSEQLPAASLLAGCPVSLRKAGDKTLNNQVGMMRVALGTHLSHPLVRLLFVKESSRRARPLALESSVLLPRHPAIPGLPAAMRFSAIAADWMAAAPGPIPTPVNVIVSNVPGPSGLLHVAGALMESHYPVSIPAHGLAVNLTVQSYAGEMHLGVTACARALPDAAILRDDLMAAFRDLRAHCLPAALPVVGLPESAPPPDTAEPSRQAA